MALKDIFHSKEKTESQVPPMKIFDNITEIVRDDLQKTIKKNGRVSVAAACFSMYAYQELKQQLDQVDEFRFIFTSPTFIKEKAEKQKREFYIPRLHRENSLYGTEFEIKLRNELTQRAIAKECANWIKAKAKFKSNTTGEHMGGFMTVASPSEQYAYAPINGFTTVDIGRERGNNSYNMVQGMEAPFATQYMQLFDTLWNDQNKMQDVTEIVIENISNAYNENSPEFIYFMTLYHVFSEFLEDISEDTLPNEATGFKQSQIWNKLYDFQKDAVLAIINKLEKYNGCILADSVGLGKTFTALAVIKYYENRNKSVLVLCPKKLAENRNTYKDNYVNNPIAKDRLNYDVLFHTDLSRNGGQSNGLDLDRLNWGNYDLVVIDESHNFRNGGELSGDDAKENRYLRLLNKVVRAGVKTKVLMLSATPVNNRFNDLKNQLALAYEGDSTLINDKLNTSKSIDEIFRQAQTAFNAWSKLEPEDRTTDSLLRTLDFDFFEVLDSVTIARSRKHIEKYYNSSPFCTKLVCGDCGSFYGHKIYHAKEKHSKDVWYCNRRYHGSNNCSTPILAEDDLVKYYLQALSKILENKEKCISACRAKMNKADALEKIRQKRIKAETDLARDMEKIQALVKENAYISQDQQVYRKRFEEISKQIEQQKSDIANLQEQELSLIGVREKLSRFIETLESFDSEPAFDSATWNVLVERVLVNPENLVFEFKNGEEIKVSI